MFDDVQMTVKQATDEMGSVFFHVEPLACSKGNYDEHVGIEDRM